MNWTTEAPKQDGWYWWRRDEMDPPEVVQLQRGTVMWAGDDVGTMVGGMSGEFLGPLDPFQVLAYESLVKELHLTRLALEDERQRCIKIVRDRAHEILSKQEPAEVGSLGYDINVNLRMLAAVLSEAADMM